MWCLKGEYVEHLPQSALFGRSNYIVIGLAMWCGCGSAHFTSFSVEGTRPSLMYSMAQCFVPGHC